MLLYNFTSCFLFTFKDLIASIDLFFDNNLNIYCFPISKLQFQSRFLSFSKVRKLISAMWKRFCNPNSLNFSSFTTGLSIKFKWVSFFKFKNAFNSFRSWIWLLSKFTWVSDSQLHNGEIIWMLLCDKSNCFIYFNYKNGVTSVIRFLDPLNTANLVSYSIPSTDSIF